MAKINLKKYWKKQGINKISVMPAKIAIKKSAKRYKGRLNLNCQTIKHLFELVPKYTQIDFEKAG